MGKRRKGPKFGKGFQRHLLSILAQQPQAAAQLHAFVIPGFFESDRMRAACKFLQKTWQEFKTLPSKELFLENVPDRQLAKDLYDADVTDWKAAIAHAGNFAQIQAVKVFIDTWADRVAIVKPDDIDAMVADAKDAVFTGQSVNKREGDFFHRDLKQRLLDYRFPPEEAEPLPSGLTHIDIAMRGGIIRGELVLIMGVTKSGKSMFLTNVIFGAAGAMTAAKVAFFSLETSKRECWSRFDRRLVLKNDDYLKKHGKKFATLVEKRAGLIAGEIYMTHYPPNTMTSAMLEAELEELMAGGFIPDILIVDSGNLMKPTRWYKEKRDREAAGYNELARISSEYQIGVWSAVQANREAMNRITVGKENVGESWGIAHIIDGLWTISQTKQEKIKNRCRLVAAAGRRWPDGISIDCNMNLDMALFQTTGFTKHSDVEEGTEKGFGEIGGYHKQKKKGKKK